jgi:hypothetical protein
MVGVEVIVANTGVGVAATGVGGGVWAKTTPTTARAMNTAAAMDSFHMSDSGERHLRV